MISLIRIWAYAGAMARASAKSVQSAEPRRGREWKRGSGPNWEGLLPARGWIWLGFRRNCSRERGARVSSASHPAHGREKVSGLDALPAIRTPSALERL